MKAPQIPAPPLHVLIALTTRMRGKEPTRQEATGSLFPFAVEHARQIQERTLFSSHRP
jgi:hypothetical protein